MVTFDEEKQKLKLAELRQKEEEDFVKIAAGNRGLDYIALTMLSTEADALKLVGETVAREAGTAVFGVKDKRINVATVNPDDTKSKALMQTFKDSGYEARLFLVSRHSMEEVWKKYADLPHLMAAPAGTFKISNEEIAKNLSAVHTTTDVKTAIGDALKDQKNFSTTRVVEIILAGALATDASDVHIEPESENVRLRYRLDGVLVEIITMTSDVYHYLNSRIKLISGLKLNVTADAQDGRFSIKANGGDIEVRTSTLPGAYGESLVMRLLNPDTIALSMEELGFEPRLKVVIERELTRTNGMILNTGPTGSGKTTTLYAFLKKIYSPGVKVITIEDPIEYHLSGIVQTQVNPEKGYTFHSGLRAALRQDPDIIMIGEIRDAETAETAVNAALTGHLVFSTLHTNNAAGTFPRLLDLGINPKVVSSALSAAMAQRLVRKLCPFCKKEVSLTGKDKEIVERIAESIHIPEYKSIPRKTMWKGVGCRKCNNTGYKGRIGIFEIILASKKIEEAVLTNPSERDIEEAAREQEQLTLPQDGIVKVLRGLTSLDELRRVIYIDDV